MPAKVTHERRAGRGRRAKDAGHGGARHGRDRLTYWLTERQCRDLMQAVERATQSGRPFNRWITIAWGRNGIDPRDNRKISGQWIKLASDWMRRQGHKLIWAYVQEASDRNGAHVHILLHVPDAIAPLWRYLPGKWVAQLVGQRPVGGTLRSQKHATGEPGSYSALAHQIWLIGKAHYMLKAAPKPLEQKLGMVGKGYKPWGKSCAVFGVRLSIWQGWRRA